MESHLENRSRPLLAAANQLSALRQDQDRSEPIDSNATRDLWFNPHLSPASKRAWDVVREVWESFGSYPKRKRAMKSEGLAKPGSVCATVVCNLIYHHLTGSSGDGVPVPRAKRQLGGKATRYQQFVFPRSFPTMLDTLCDLGFVEQTIGSYSGIPGKSKRTTIRAGTRLVELIEQHQITLDDLSAGGGEEIIVLKRPRRGHFDEGARVDYKDTPTTHRYRDELRAINAWLAKADIQFDPAAHDQPVDVQARRLYRIFNLGRFDCGGRLFGGFWQNLSKDVRLKGIMIDGEAVIGLDYSQLNPRLAYSLAKAVPPPRDAYTLPGLEDHRDGVKKIFNAMLFNYPVEKFPKGSRVLFPRRVKCQDVTAAILEHHPNLKGVLSSLGIGYHLMFLESEIMMGVLRACHRRNMVALPVFDCVVVKKSQAAITEKIMRREFNTKAGLDIEVRRETSP